MKVIYILVRVAKRLHKVLQIKRVRVIVTGILAIQILYTHTHSI